MINKSFKVLRVTLNSNGSGDKMLIGHNRLLRNDQEMVEEVEQQAVLDDQVEEIEHNLDYRRDYPDDMMILSILK